MSVPTISTTSTPQLLAQLWKLAGDDSRPGEETKVGDLSDVEAMGKLWDRLALSVNGLSPTTWTNLDRLGKELAQLWTSETLPERPLTQYQSALLELHETFLQIHDHWTKAEVMAQQEHQEAWKAYPSAMKEYGRQQKESITRIRETEAIIQEVKKELSSIRELLRTDPEDPSEEGMKEALKKRIAFLEKYLAGLTEDLETFTQQKQQPQPKKPPAEPEIPLIKEDRLTELMEKIHQVLKLMDPEYQPWNHRPRLLTLLLASLSRTYLCPEREPLLASTPHLLEELKAGLKRWPDGCPAPEVVFQDRLMIGILDQLGRAVPHQPKCLPAETNTRVTEIHTRLRELGMLTWWNLLKRANLQSGRRAGSNGSSYEEVVRAQLGSMLEPDTKQIPEPGTQRLFASKKGALSWKKQRGVDVLTFSTAEEEELKVGLGEFKSSHSSYGVAMQQLLGRLIRLRLGLEKMSNPKIREILEDTEELSPNFWESCLPMSSLRALFTTLEVSEEWHEEWSEVLELYWQVETKEFMVWEENPGRVTEAQKLVDWFLQQVPPERAEAYQLLKSLWVVTPSPTERTPCMPGKLMQFVGTFTLSHTGKALLAQPSILTSFFEQMTKRGWNHWSSFSSSDHFYAVEWST